MHQLQNKGVKIQSEHHEKEKTKRTTIIMVLWLPKKKHGAHGPSAALALVQAGDI
jgi:hypothetical protein